jgi:hypothetical protein
MRFYAVRRYPGYVYYQTEIRDNYEVVSAGTAAPGRRWAGPGRGARAAPASERRARREGSEARAGAVESRARVMTFPRAATPTATEHNLDAHT